MTWKKIISSKAVLTILSILVLVMAFLELRQYQQRRQIAREIASLEQQKDDLQGKNQVIADSLSYFDSQEYKERIAREELNLQREGEQVVIFPEVTNNDVGATQNQGPVKPNAQKWWEYLFHNSK